jgi:hypothetical protein
VAACPITYPCRFPGLSGSDGTLAVKVAHVRAVSSLLHESLGGGCRVWMQAARMPNGGAVVGRRTGRSRPPGVVCRLVWSVGWEANLTWATTRLVQLFARCSHPRRRYKGLPPCVNRPRLPRGSDRRRMSVPTTSWDHDRGTRPRESHLSERFKTEPAPRDYLTTRRRWTSHIRGSLRCPASLATTEYF